MPRCILHLLDNPILEFCVCCREERAKKHYLHSKTDTMLSSPRELQAPVFLPVVRSVYNCYNFVLFCWLGFFLLVFCCFFCCFYFLHQESKELRIVKASIYFTNSNTDLLQKPGEIMFPLKQMGLKIVLTKHLCSKTTYASPVKTQAASAPHESIKPTTLCPCNNAFNSF